MEVEEFLAGIQEQLDTSVSPGAGQVSAVQFFPPAYPGTDKATIPELPSRDNVCEQDDLLPTSHIADPVGRDGCTSGIEQRQRCGSLESRRSSEAMPQILSRLKELGLEMQVTLDQIGSVPSNPGTVRGALGRWIILLFRRVLWWHTRSVSAFADVVTRELKEQVALLEHLSTIQEENQRTLVSIQQALAGMGARLEESASEQRQVAARTSQLESDVRLEKRPN
jgi:hypothetical protein